MNKKDFTLLEKILIPLVAIMGLVIFLTGRALAEQVGDSPTSGESSVVMDIYDELYSLGYGEETGSLGPVWNRIYSASVQPVGLDWEKQSLLKEDDRDGLNHGETSSCKKTNEEPEVWYDEVTRLYWSPNQGTMKNDFDRFECEFYETVPRGDYDGSDTDCADSINECATLSLATHTDGDEKTDWYLPSQLELMQAYINGIYKETDADWLQTSHHWSSTEAQHSTAVVYTIDLKYGGTDLYSKLFDSLPVRCVLRD